MLHQGVEEKQTNIPKERAPKRFLWSEASKQKFSDILRTPEFSQKLDAALELDYGNPNDVVDYISDTMISAAEKAEIKTSHKSEHLKGPPWFDIECSNVKQKMKSLGKKIRKNPTNQIYKNDLSKLKKNFKKLVRNKKLVYKNKIMEKLNLSKNDSKRFWNLLDKLEHNCDDSRFISNISEARWVAHFKSIFQGPHGKCTFPENTARQGVLDFEISAEEIELGTYILRNGKSPGYDSISNEMISCLLTVKPDIVRKLFNSILQNPVTIVKWNTSLIFPLHKKGSKVDPNNFRGISLLSCFSKFFLAILNQRLTKFALDNKIFSSGQLGFVKGCRTSDALLILHNLIEYYCTKLKEKIFSCFIDFSKAFDTVPRHKLFQKLLDNNINGKFYECLVSLYSEDKSCVKLGDNMTKEFQSNQGVKQGCILSPTLFNIFLSDLQSKVEVNACEPVRINPEEKLGGLIWADDVIFLSKSELGLKNMLQILNSYTEENGMTLNIDKTKVMIFNRSGRHMRRSFDFGARKIETTRQYKYLGFLVTPSGEITTGLNDLKDRAQKAFYALKHKLGTAFKNNPLITIKLFNTLVKPILLYASDFWGIRKLPQNNPIENLHISFCKQLLGVQKQTTNIGVLLELGQIPLSIHAKNTAIKNWVRISNKLNANRMVMLSYENALTFNLSWPIKIRETLSEIGMFENFLHKSKDTHFIALQRLSDIFHQNSFAKINDEVSKLRTYGTIKSKIGYEEYLSDIHNIQDRIAYTKLRLSNHRLMIETGRHSKNPKHLRFCPFCPSFVEDEMHFLLDCKTFQSHRNMLFDTISEEVENFLTFDRNEKFHILLNSPHTISPHTAKYIASTLNIREFLIGNHKNCI